jgi:hypothetical protein
MKLSKLERFLLVVFVVYILFPISTLRLLSGFVSAEYVGHVFDYGVSVFYTCRLSWAFFTFCGVRTDPPQFGLATSTYRPNQLYAHVAKQYSARPNHKEYE